MLEAIRQMTENYKKTIEAVLDFNMDMLGDLSVEDLLEAGVEVSEALTQAKLASAMSIPGVCVEKEVNVLEKTLALIMTSAKLKDARFRKCEIELAKEKLG